MNEEPKQKRGRRKVSTISRNDKLYNLIYPQPDKTEVTTAAKPDDLAHSEDDSTPTPPNPEKVEEKEDKPEEIKVKSLSGATKRITAVIPKVYLTHYILFCNIRNSSRLYFFVKCQINKYKNFYL